MKLLTVRWTAMYPADYPDSNTTQVPCAQMKLLQDYCFVQATRY